MLHGSIWSGLWSTRKWLHIVTALNCSLNLADSGYPILGPLVLLLPKLQDWLSNLRFWGYLMKVILRVPDEGLFEGTWWRLFWGYLMKVILRVPDEGYFECTWWRLFWGYLMKVILRVPDEGYFEKRTVRTRFDLYVFIELNIQLHRSLTMHT